MLLINYKADRKVRSLVFGAILLFLPTTIFADTFLHGEPVWPAFEGWRPNADGTFSFIFGYMNENWEEVPYVDVGENNFFSPGEADRGQPTNFMPRRNRFTFEVTVPSDWGDRELVSTLR